MKLKGSIILEPLIALNIISVILLLTVMIFSNLAKSNTGFLILFAQGEIDSFQADLKCEEDSYDYGNVTIFKTVSKYNNSESIFQITWEAIDFKEQLIYTQHQLILKDEE